MDNNHQATPVIVNAVPPKLLAKVVNALLIFSLTALIFFAAAFFRFEEVRQTSLRVGIQLLTKAVECRVLGECKCRPTP